jgi:hypothetical protein
MFLANNVQGTGSATTSGGFVVTATATASASSNISQADANTQALKLATSLAQSSAQNQANIMDQTIVINDSPAITPDTITLYYSKNSTLFPPTELDLQNSQDTYSGVQNMYMTNSSWETANTDIITFLGYRTPKGNTTLPNLYCETVIIKTQEGDFISGLANYVDSGSGSDTTSSSENYAVMCASGKFSGYKNINITFNTNLTRVVKITN